MHNNPKVPPEEFTFRHIIPLQTRFNDVDALGHLNNTVYFSFADLGKYRYMEDVIGDMKMDQVSAVIVNISCNFYAPAFFDEPLVIKTAVTSIGPKSIHVEQRVVNPETGEVKCVILTILAGWDRSTGLSAPIEQEWVEKMEAYEQRALKK